MFLSFHSLYLLTDHPVHLFLGLSHSKLCSMSSALRAVCSPQDGSAMCIALRSCAQQHFMSGHHGAFLPKMALNGVQVRKQNPISRDSVDRACSREVTGSANIQPKAQQWQQSLKGQHEFHYGRGCPRGWNHKGVLWRAREGLETMF